MTDCGVPAENRLAIDCASLARAAKFGPIWLLTKLPGQIRVRFSDDVTEKYLLLSNSHDGSSALRVHYTSIRVVCANTLSLADRERRSEGIAIRHQGNLASKVWDAQNVLGLARRYFDDLEGQMDVMARHYPNPTSAAIARKAMESACFREVAPKSWHYILAIPFGSRRRWGSSRPRWCRRIDWARSGRTTQRSRTVGPSFVGKITSVL